MRTGLTIFLCVWLGAFSYAQSPPDFTFTDIHGTEHRLSTTLAAGKTVILDFFKTDCEPCLYWIPATNELYNNWGSGNADVELWAFSGEDDNTGLQALASDSGISFTLCGIEGGAATIVEMYAEYFSFTGYPTYAVICPEGEMEWDIWPLTAGIPEINDKVAACGATGVVTYAEGPDQEILIGCIWPNPTEGALHVHLDEKISLQDQVKVTVYTLSGNAVYNQYRSGGREQLDLELGNLRPGMYVLLVTDAGRVIEKEKFIKL